MFEKIEYEYMEKIGTCFYLRDAAYDKSRKAEFLCYRCGNRFITHVMDLKGGRTKSCGCLRSNLLSDRASTHGLSHTLLYGRYTGIKLRCYNPNFEYYEYYGGRGITMCDEWKNDFTAFRDYVMALPNAMGDGLTIDREENDGNYEPGNLRWATRREQSINQRKRMDNRSGYTGVYERKDGKYIASMGINGGMKYLGIFKAKKEALEARNNYITENELWEYPIQKWRG